MEEKATPQENKSERFRRIAEQRTNRIINDLRLLANTANKNSYTYTDEEIDKIFSAIDTKLSDVKSHFRRSRDERFKL